jgi:hypothetical protein
LMFWLLTLFFFFFCCKVNSDDPSDWCYCASAFDDGSA